MARVVSLAVLLFSSYAYAGLFDGIFGDPKNAYAGEFQAPPGQHSLYNSQNWLNLAPEEYAGCRAQYDQWFADGVLEVSLMMGYLDSSTSPVPMDRENFRMIRSILLRQGFKRVANRLPGNITVLERVMPDYSGQNRPLKLRLVLGYSAATDDDRLNVGLDGIISPRQRQFSEDAEAQFFGSIASRSCEVCGYVGHARNGGGPDFRPVPYAWRDRDNEPEYSFYLEKRASYRHLLESVAASSQQGGGQLISIMGCKSASHFWEGLSAYAGNQGFVLSDLLSWPQNRDQYVGALMDGLVGLKCRSAFDRNLNSLRHLAQPEAYKIEGRFL